MKVKVKKQDILKQLQKVSNIIGSRTTIPILANVLMEAEGNTLTLTTTDLELRVITHVEAEVIEAGKTTLPAKKLLGLVKKLRGECVSISSNENYHSEIKCGTASIMLLGLNPDDFPVQAESSIQRSIKMKQSDLSSMIDKISYAASMEDSRKVLQGILFSIRNGKMTAAATDGKRLALVEKVLDEVSCGSDGDIIVTLKSATELKRIIEKDGDIFIDIGDNQVVFRVDQTKIISKLIEGTYPNYKQVIPPSFKKCVSVPCDQFIYAMEVLSITLSETTAPTIKLTFKGNKLIFEANSSIGAGSESIDVEYTDEEMSASFNPHFLLDPFKHLPVDHVLLKINDVVSPIAIESGDGFLYILMPSRKH